MTEQKLLNKIWKTAAKKFKLIEGSAIVFKLSPNVDEKPLDEPARPERIIHIKTQPLINARNELAMLVLFAIMAYH